MNAAETIGYYNVDGDAFCVACAPDDDDELLDPIFGDAEVDSPVHCTKCEGYLGVGLTPEGVAYVLESVRQWLAGSSTRPWRTPDTGREEILDQWVDDLWSHAIPRAGSISRDEITLALYRYMREGNPDLINDRDDLLRHVLDNWGEKDFTDASTLDARANSEADRILDLAHEMGIGFGEDWLPVFDEDWRRRYPHLARDGIKSGGSPSMRSAVDAAVRPIRESTDDPS
jgi:hypothetical protein